ncbi:MAG: phosphatase PAP2 family protein [Phycisphaerae bacterium]
MGCRSVGMTVLGLALLSAGCQGPLGPGPLGQFRGELGRIGRAREALVVAAPARHLEPARGQSWLSGSAHRYEYSLAGYSIVQEEPPSRPSTRHRPARASRRAGPLPDLWGTIKRDLEEMPDDLWTDTKAVYGSPENLLILGLAYGGSLAVQEGGPDDTVENSFADGHRTFKDDWLDGFGVAGNPGTHFALAGLWYLVGQQAQDEKTYNVGKTLFSALIINGLSTMVGQTATWDHSPNGEWGVFPSGHTSSTFTFASVMHQAYGHWVGGPLYALSALVAYERLESEEHYLADVLMGGVMGLVIGHTVSGEHEISFWGGRIEPFVDPASQTSGLAWVKHFR